MLFAWGAVGLAAGRVRRLRLGRLAVGEPHGAARLRASLCSFPSRRSASAALPRRASTAGVSPPPRPPAPCGATGSTAWPPPWRCGGISAPAPAAARWCGSRPSTCIPAAPPSPPHRRRLGEVLVALGYVSTADLELALAVRREGERIGECLVRLGKLSGEGLNRGLDTMGTPADPADRTRPPSTSFPPASECIAPLRGGA